MCDLVRNWRLELIRALVFILGWALSLLPASQASISFDSTRPCTSSAGPWCAAMFLRPESSKLPDQIISTWECCCSSSSCPPCLSCTWLCLSRHLSIVAPSGLVFEITFGCSFVSGMEIGMTHHCLNYFCCFFFFKQWHFGMQEWDPLGIQAHYVTWRFLVKFHVFSHLGVIKGKII